jgi:hypothetical protein
MQLKLVVTSTLQVSELGGLDVVAHVGGLGSEGEPLSEEVWRGMYDTHVISSVVLARVRQGWAGGPCSRRGCRCCQQQDHVALQPVDLLQVCAS